MAAWQFPTELNILLPDESAMVLLHFHPNNLKAYVHTKTSARMFIAALFVTAKMWQQPRCPSVGEWITKLWSIQIMEYYLALNGEEF